MPEQIGHAWGRASLQGSCRAVQEFLVAAVHQKRSTLEGPGFKLAGWRVELGLDKCPTRVLLTRLLLPGRSRWQWAIDVGPGRLAGFGWFLEGRQASNLCRAAEEAQGRIQKTRPSLGFLVALRASSDTALVTVSGRGGRM